MRSNGRTVGAGILGLLLSNGGTVCDDGFSSNSADAICREMGHYGYTMYTYGFKWSIQSEFHIELDEVKCSSGDWESCSFQTSNDCSHDEDVFLQCDGVGEQILFCYSSISLPR